jgi:hypothetical protein
MFFLRHDRTCLTIRKKPLLASEISNKISGFAGR